MGSVGLKERRFQNMCNKRTQRSGFQASTGIDSLLPSVVDQASQLLPVALCLEAGVHVFGGTENDVLTDTRALASHR